MRLKARVGCCTALSGQGNRSPVLPGGRTISNTLCCKWDASILHKILTNCQLLHNEIAYPWRITLFYPSQQVYWCLYLHDLSSSGSPLSCDFSSRSTCSTRRYGYFIQIKAAKITIIAASDHLTPSETIARYIQSSRAWHGLLVGRKDELRFGKRILVPQNVREPVSSCASLTGRNL